MGVGRPGDGDGGEAVAEPADGVMKCAGGQVGVGPAGAIAGELGVEISGTAASAASRLRIGLRSSQLGCRCPAEQVKPKN